MLREEERIRATLVYIQVTILSKMNVLKKHIAHAKTLIHDNNFSIVDHMIELSPRSSDCIAHKQGVARKLGQDNGTDSKGTF